MHMPVPKEGRWGGVGPRKPQDARRAFKRCMEWARPLMPILVFGLVCAFAGVYLSQQPPRIIQYTIDNVIGHERYNLLGRVILLYIGILVLGQIIGSASGYWMTVAGQRLLHTLRMALYDHFQSLSVGYYDDKRTGDLVARVTHDVNHVEGLIVGSSVSLVRQVFGVGLAFYYMLTYNWQLALLVLIPIPILGISLYVFTRRIRVVYRSIRESMGGLSAKLMENLAGIQVIKAFNRESQEHDVVEGISHHLLSENIRASRMTSIFFPAIHTVSSMGTVVVLGVGAYLISHGLFTVGELAAYLIYVSNFYQPIGDFIRTSDAIQRALASDERIFEVLDTKPSVKDPPKPIPLRTIRGEVEFRNVSFRYPTGEEVLSGVNVHALPGQRVALVGKSGAGKSSFISLIPRFYDVTTSAAVAFEAMNGLHQPHPSLLRCNRGCCANRWH